MTSRETAIEFLKSAISNPNFDPLKADDWKALSDQIPFINSLVDESSRPVKASSARIC